MTKELAGLFEVTIAEAVEVLTAHAKSQGIRVTSEGVRQLLLDQIANGTLKATVLVRDVSGKIDVGETTLDPRMFLEDDRHDWLVEHGLHSPQEADSDDFPEFPSILTDFAILDWIENVLPELRYLLLENYELCDLKASRVGRTVAAMFNTEAQVSSELVENIKAARLKIQIDADSIPREQEPLHQKERDSLLKLAIGMAMAGYNYDPSSKRNSATSEIARDLTARGLGLDEDTVRKWLKTAAELIERK